MGAFTENFRSALNGFNRTDVVQFIQRQTAEHEKALRLLREENARLAQNSMVSTGDTDRLKAEAQALQAQLAELQAQNASLAQKNAELVQKNAELEQQLGVSAEEKAALQQELDAFKQEEAEPDVEETLDAPMEAPAGVAPTPVNFNELELAAYRRAEQAERMARERAAASSDRMKNILDQTGEKINLTTADMNQLVEAFQANCAQMQALMENARNILAESAEGVKAASELSGVV